MNRVLTATIGGAAALVTLGAGFNDAADTASAVVAAGWVIAAAGCLASGRPAVARWAGLVAVLQGAAAIWPQAVPLAIAGWLGFALALPDGDLKTLPRRIVTGLGTLGGLALTLLVEVSPGAYATAAVVAAGTGTVAIVARCGPASPRQRAALQWTGAALLLAAAAGAVIIGLYLLLGVPQTPMAWLVGALVIVPVGALFGHLPPTAHVGEKALLEAVVVAGFAVMIASVYLVVVLGLGRLPAESERDLLVSSMAAALVVAILAIPVRNRLLHTARAITGRGGVPPEEILATFGARMSRAVPFDELLLQLAESLKAAMAPAGAEIWVGSDGVLQRTVSVPDLPPERITLNDRERVIVGRTRIGGPSWLAIWLPGMLPEGGGLVRVAPAAHLGELLGMIVVRRPPDAPPFSENDDQVLVQLARQVGLALHNMRLDSALQASLDELRRRNEELQASRLRIVTSADAARRAIERDLHDGAQQHLVALSVKLSLAGEIIAEDPDVARTMMGELREDVQGTIGALRELAHGVYPPLLRNHGLDQAMRSAARRSALPCAVSVDLPRRFSEETEAAVYFCCLEAIQNAGKHAGADAAIDVEITADDKVLRFTVTDDGAGFESAGEGHGFVNMRDRLGAIGGTLTVDSAIGAGTTIRGEIPHA
ncbi:histidine kinase [Herbidospora sp. NBRC 101105]|uniref:sensor histidine kinase n=1 Tax=Herbidospora sp. NBRC 101105 TaxID=3032195 RepID=UPI002556856E|nr:histidine kinase [Herbidospora sp. NBRC 101105]